MAEISWEFPHCGETDIPDGPIDKELIAIHFLELGSPSKCLFRVLSRASAT
jgi:hypothetical protein